MRLRDIYNLIQPQTSNLVIQTHVRNDGNNRITGIERVNGAIIEIEKTDLFKDAIDAEEIQNFMKVLQT